MSYGQSWHNYFQQLTSENTMHIEIYPGIYHAKVGMGSWYGWYMYKKIVCLFDPKRIQCLSVSLQTILC